jgi:cell division protein FtsB
VNEFAAKPRSQKGIWHSLNRFVITLIVMAITLPLCHSFLPEFDKQRELDVRVDDLKAAIEHQRLVLQRHQHEENLLKHDPDYVGMIARDRLDLMKEGETVYRIAAPSAQAPQAQLTGAQAPR